MSVNGNMDQQKIIIAVENICSTGCVSVNAVIQTLETGKKVAGIEGFSEAELTILKNELKSIMAVYENR